MVVVSIEVLLALGRILISVLAEVEDLVVFFLVSVVVVIVVVVVVFFLDILARDAVTGNQRFLCVWKRSSVVEALIDSRLAGLGGTGLISKDGEVDVKSIGASGSNVILLVVTIVAVVIVVVIVVVVVITVAVLSDFCNGVGK